MPPNNRPDALGYAVIQNFFVEKMNYVSPEQLILAIDLANQKKFECDLTLYNRTFSVGFITPIVINYLAYEKTIKDTKIAENQKKLAVKTKPTNEEIAEMNDKFFKESFETFCKIGWFEDIGNALHTLLVLSGKIGVLTHEKYTSEAKTLLEVKYSKENAKNYVQRGEFNRVLSEIENNSAPQLEIMAKKICINEFFLARKETIIKSLI